MFISLRKPIVIVLIALMLALTACARARVEEEPAEQAAAEESYGDFEENSFEAEVEEEMAEEEAMVDEDFAFDPADELAPAEERSEAPGDASGAPAPEPSAGEGFGSDGDFESFEEEESFADDAESFAPEADAIGGAGEFVDVPDVEFVQPLQAGEINDNDMFNDYLSYRRQFLQSGWDDFVYDMDVSERHEITVVTRRGIPVLGATIEIYAGGQDFITSMTTPATGTVYFHPRAYPGGRGQQNYDVVIFKDQAETDFDLQGGQSANYTIELDAPPTRTPVDLDVLFLLDATGSMGDEIDQLKDNILSISAQVEALPANPNVRFGMVTYRDRGEEYVTRNYGFTGDVEAFQSALINVEASGGGDVPEALNEGLHEAVSDVDWRSGETVKLIFLVSDAPPHLDYVQDYDYTEEMQAAIEQGIKIHTIASSGLEDEGPHGEFIYRQLAQFTGGNFIFLTYDDQPRSDQEPGREVSVDEQDYSVEDLDALVIRLIEAELAVLDVQ